MNKLRDHAKVDVDTLRELKSEITQSKTKRRDVPHCNGSAPFLSFSYLTTNLTKKSIISPTQSIVMQSFSSHTGFNPFLFFSLVRDEMEVHGTSITRIKEIFDSWWGL